MAASVAPLTVEQFLALPEELTLRKELIDGEIVDMGIAGSMHEWLKARFMEELVLYVQSHRELVCTSESMYLVNPKSGLIPDVAILNREWAKSS